MLYVTTRGNRDAFTAHRTLCTSSAPDNGFFLPMRFPHFSESELRTFVSAPFEENIAYILNAFFSTKLTKWDIEVCLGGKTVRIQEAYPNILLAELWHNPDNSFAYVVKGLYDRIYGQGLKGEPSEWFKLTIKIAFWFGIYCDLCRHSLVSFGAGIDISVPADDFAYPISALYANLAGLPIGNIVCNCTNTNEVWNLIHRGKLNTNTLSDSLRAGMERFLLLRLGPTVIGRIRDNKSFAATQEEATELRRGLFCVVSGADRVLHTVNGVFSASGRFVTPATALCIAGLGDYRAQTGESRRTLVLQEDSPVRFADQIEDATGITKRKLIEKLKE